MRIKLMNVNDHDDIFVAETNTIDHSEAVSPDGRVYILAGVSPAGEMWSQKAAKGWTGRVEECVRL